jgi:hypothetical protein
VVMVFLGVERTPEANMILINPSSSKTPLRRRPRGPNLSGALSFVGSRALGQFLARVGSLKPTFYGARLTRVE